MKIEMQSKKNVSIRFRDLEQGEAFTFLDEPKELFMKTSDIWDGGLTYNCVRIKDGKMYAAENTINIMASDAYIIQKED